MNFINLKICRRLSLLLFFSFSFFSSLLYANLENSPSSNLKVASFAGGCFWSMQPPYDEVVGIEMTIVGFTGGQGTKPTYEDVALGKTGHAEAIQIFFDPDIISNKQFSDIGS